MLSLTVKGDSSRSFQAYKELVKKSLELLATPWPDDVVPAQNLDQGEDEVADEELVDEEELKKVNEELFKDTTVQSLAESYELEEEGQRRFWIKQAPTNCCYASFKMEEGHTLCRRTSECLYCCGKHTEGRYEQYGLLAHYSVAAVNVHAKKHFWNELPTDSIFEFIYELDQRLIGAADLRKELSHYGATRCTPREVQHAIRSGTLMDYHVQITHNRNGIAFCRATMDPNNQVYAGWYCTIAVNARPQIWSNHRQRLGAPSEAAPVFR